MGKANGKPRRFVSVKELARHLKVPESTLMAVLAEGSYHFARFGDELLVVERDAVKALVKLNGNGDVTLSPLIHLNEAAHRYRLSLRVIQRLIQAGYLKVAGREKNKVLIRASDLEHLIALGKFLGIKPTCKAFSSLSS